MEPAHKLSYPPSARERVGFSALASPETTHYDRNAFWDPTKRQLYSLSKHAFTPVAAVQWHPLTPCVDPLKSPRPVIHFRDGDTPSDGHPVYPVMLKHDGTHVRSVEHRVPSLHPALRDEHAVDIDHRYIARWYGTGKPVAVGLLLYTDTEAGPSRFATYVLWRLPSFLYRFYDELNIALIVPCATLRLRDAIWTAQHDGLPREVKVTMQFDANEALKVIALADEH